MPRSTSAACYPDARTVPQLRLKKQSELISPQAPPLMTRRTLLQSTLLGAGATSCARKGRPETLAAVSDMAKREDLVGSRLSGIVGAPEALTVTGADTGPLAVIDGASDLSVSPDGAWVAWTLLSSLPHLGTEQPLVLFTDDPRSIQRVRFRGKHAEAVAISSRARCLAFTAFVDAAVRIRLIVLSPATAQIQQDVTELIKGLDLLEVKRLRISSNGQVLCAASRESFVVLDLPARRVVLESNGRFPSLSPNGSSLAFLDTRGDFVITTLATGARRVITSPWWTVVGVGGWSPDGKFLLAGARPAFSVFIHLVAIDCATDEFAEITELDEGDFGETSVWLKRRLLSKVRPGAVA
jgi:hypothetical protein